MPTMKMRDVKVGEAIMYNNEVWVIFDRHEQTRGNLRTYWQIKLKHLERGNVVEEAFYGFDGQLVLTKNRGNAREVWTFDERDEEASVEKFSFSSTVHKNLDPWISEECRLS